MFFVLFLKTVIRSFPFFNEQIAQVTYQKWATMSDSLKLLTKNEQPWAIRSGGSPKMSYYEGIAQVAHQNEQMSKLLFFLAYHSFAHFFAKNERFALKTDEQIPNPDPDHLTQ